MVWSVDTLTREGVISLKNDASGSYLDQNGKWYLNTAYPEPLSIRQLNDDGTVKLYHRPSLDNADSCYLYVYYQKEDGLAEGTIDRYKNNESKGAEFALYQKANARSIDVTITNRATRIPVAIKSVEYPSVTAFSGVTFDLYTKEAYESASGGAPLMRQLVAGDDGFVREGGQGPLLELSAGTLLPVSYE